MVRALNLIEATVEWYGSWTTSVQATIKWYGFWKLEPCLGDRRMVRVLDNLSSGDRRMVRVLENLSSGDRRMVRVLDNIQATLEWYGS